MVEDQKQIITPEAAIGQPGAEQTHVVEAIRVAGGADAGSLAVEHSASTTADVLPPQRWRGAHRMLAKVATTLKVQAYANGASPKQVKSYGEFIRDGFGPNANAASPAVRLETAEPLTPKIRKA